MNVRIILFNVGRGVCAYIRSPNKYPIIIDCAKTDTFSPIERIIEYEIPSTSEFDGYKLAQFMLSHPHDDHLSDIETLRTKLPPKIMTGMKQDLEDVKDPDVTEGYENLDSYIDWRPTYCQPITSYPDWGMNYHWSFGLTNEKAKEISVNPKQWTNNASIPAVIEYEGNKIFFPGDIMEEAWDVLLERSSFISKLKDTTFFVASHHGLKSGYNQGIFDIINPKVVLVSERPGEPIHSAYSNSELVQGIQFGENKDTRYMISTKTGSIFLELKEGGKYGIAQYDLPDNIEVED